MLTPMKETITLTAIAGAGFALVNAGDVLLDTPAYLRPYARVELAAKSVLLVVVAILLMLAIDWVTDRVFDLVARWHNRR